MQGRKGLGMRRILVPALLFLLGLPAEAKELKILTGAGMSMPVQALATEFGGRTGDNVTVVSDTAGGVQKRIEAGEKFDLVIGTIAVLDKLTRKTRCRRITPIWRKWSPVFPPGPAPSNRHLQTVIK